MIAMIVMLRPHLPGSRFPRISRSFQLNQVNIKLPVRLEAQHKESLLLSQEPLSCLGFSENWQWHQWQDVTRVLKSPKMNSENRGKSCKLIKVSNVSNVSKILGSPAVWRAQDRSRTLGAAKICICCMCMSVCVPDLKGRRETSRFLQKAKRRAKWEMLSLPGRMMLNAMTALSWNF